MAPTNTLHLYPQYQRHSPAYVVGTRAGLEALRDALDRALRAGEGNAAAFEAFVNDGEGYDLTVALVGEGLAGLLAVPYTDECAGRQHDRAAWPWQLRSVREALSRDTGRAEAVEIVTRDATGAVTHVERIAGDPHT